jgi:hypothetical protein
MRRIRAISTGLLLATTIIDAPVKTLDQFENNEGWTFIKADALE